MSPLYRKDLSTIHLQNKSICSKIGTWNYGLLSQKLTNAFSAKSGDTVEIIERPNGGISAVLADGQANGKGNKGISTMISHRVIGNISEGVRDGSAIRAVSSRIFAEHNGMVQADLTVISADMQSNTVLISRNNPVPVFIVSEGRWIVSPQNASLSGFDQTARQPSWSYPSAQG